MIKNNGFEVLLKVLMVLGTHSRWRVGGRIEGNLNQSFSQFIVNQNCLEYLLKQIAQPQAYGQ
jgi:hypothetical protein